MTDPHSPDEPVDASVDETDEDTAADAAVISGAVDDENEGADAPTPDKDLEATPEG